jgi:hypothetical protein
MRRLQEISGSKENSIVGEFAKRAFLLKSAGAHKDESPAAVFFRQLTDYYVSRDIPGYVGPAYRCKTVAQLRALKQKISDEVAAKIGRVEGRFKLSSKRWKEVYPLILQRLQQ